LIDVAIEPLTHSVTCGQSSKTLAAKPGQSSKTLAAKPFQSRQDFGTQTRPNFQDFGHFGTKPSKVLATLVPNRPKSWPTWAASLVLKRPKSWPLRESTYVRIQPTLIRAGQKYTARSTLCASISTSTQQFFVIYGSSQREK